MSTQQDPIRLGVLMSGGGTNLPALLEAQAAGARRSGRLARVAADRAEAYGLVRAEKADVNACDRAEIARAKNSSSC